MNVIESSGLGKRYGRNWALRDCTLAIPAGHVVALVGPNGSGKTTLLHQLVGLTKPTTGRVAVLGGPATGALDRIGFVAQDAALYRSLSVGDMLGAARSLNRRFDESSARHRLDELGIPLAKKVGKLSGGQHVQVALTIVLAKRPELLILDEPVATLDPLARHEFMAALMTAVAEQGMSVLFSSHVVSELERICDYLVVLSSGQVQVAGAVDELLAGHKLLVGPTANADAVGERLPVVREQRAEAQAQLLVRDAGPAAPPGWEAHAVGLEELVLAYLRRPAARALPGPIPARRAVA